jgi:hypothetical protein
VAMKLVCVWVSSVFTCHSSFTIAPYSSVTTPWGMHEHCYTVSSLKVRSYPCPGTWQITEWGS